MQGNDRIYLPVNRREAHALLGLVNQAVQNNENTIAGTGGMDATDLPVLAENMRDYVNAPADWMDRLRFEAKEQDATVLSVSNTDTIIATVLCRLHPGPLQPAKYVVWDFNKQTGGFSSGDYHIAQTVHGVHMAMERAYKAFHKKVMTRIENYHFVPLT